MTDKDKIKQLELIIMYAQFKLEENGLYSASIQTQIALNDTREGKPISNNLENIVNSYLKLNA